MKILYVLWQDACFQGDALKTEELCDKFEVESIGFLVRETPKILSIAQDYQKTIDKWRSITHIPKSLIKKRKCL